MPHANKRSLTASICLLKLFMSKAAFPGSPFDLPEMDPRFGDSRPFSGATKSRPTESRPALDANNAEGDEWAEPG